MAVADRAICGTRTSIDPVNAKISLLAAIVRAGKPWATPDTIAATISIPPEIIPGSASAIAERIPSIALPADCPILGPFFCKPVANESKPDIIF